MKDKNAGKKKIVMAGLSGHFEYALPYMKAHGLSFAAIYADPREETAGGRARLEKAGFAVPTVGSEEELYELSPEICIVNSIPGLNSGFAMRALEHGCSVFCEKPIATERSALSELYSAFRASGKHLAAMFGTSFTPHVAAAAEAAKLAGEPRLITAQKSYRMGNREAFYSKRALYGGTIPWVSIHSLDWLYTITGLLPVEVRAFHDRRYNRGNGDMETDAACSFILENGACFLCTADYLRPSGAPTHDDDRFRIAGTDGIIEIAGGRVKITGKEGERDAENRAPRDIFEDFLAGADGKPCVNTAKKAFLLTAAALAARDAADTGKTVKIDYGEFSQA